MDAVRDDHQPAVHSLSRKRKAAGDPRQGKTSAAAPVLRPAASSSIQSSPAQPSVLDPSATPRIPAKLSSQHLSPPHPSGQQLSPQPLSSHQLSPHQAGDRYFAPWHPYEHQLRILRACYNLSQFDDAPPLQKRPRLDTTSLSSTVRRVPRKGATPYDIGDSAHSAVEPTGALALLKSGLSIWPSWSFGRQYSVSAPVSPVESSQPHVPPLPPPISRVTLKELDLDAILKNPQLRHDLLFDPGLQFRPTFSRRKRDIADNYWTTVLRELEKGCTCTAFDANGKQRDHQCVCKFVPLPKHKPVRIFSVATSDLLTLRSPSRLKPLLCELLEILISIIQPPLTPPAGLNVRPELLRPQYQQSAAHVQYLRSILDADLIQQTLEHGLFDPSGVFQVVGDIIRCYCAPMRDSVVDQMVTLAKSCAPGGTGTKADAVRAIRQCFEIMELMKLDVANHQLQTLRPYLVHSAAQFELQVFQENIQKGPVSLTETQRWLQSAFDELISENEKAAKDDCSVSQFGKYPRATQIQLAFTRAMVNLIFTPPSTLSSAPSASSPTSPVSPISPVFSSNSAAAHSPVYPETLYLDHARLATLRTDAADFTALYMLLMLFRQLVHSAPPVRRADGSSLLLRPDELLAIKKEIWEIGPAHLGQCYLQGAPQKVETEGPGPRDTPTNTHVHNSAEDTNVKWREDVHNVVLQLTMRAGEVRLRPQSIPNGASSSSMSSDTAAPATTTPTAFTSHTPQTSYLPDAGMLKVATSWAETHLRTDSLLTTLMQKRIKCAVEETTLSLLIPSLYSKTASTHESPAPASHGRVDVTAGIEPLMPEIRHLSEKLKKLISIHFNVYGTLYAQPGFLKGVWSSSSPPPSPIPALAAPVPPSRGSSPRSNLSQHAHS